MWSPVFSEHKMRSSRSAEICTGGATQRWVGPGIVAKQRHWSTQCTLGAEPLLCTSTLQPWASAKGGSWRARPQGGPCTEAEEGAIVVRRSWVGVEWDRSPSLEGRGSARFVPVGTERRGRLNGPGRGSDSPRCEGSALCPGDRDLPTVTQSWRGGSGAECQPRVPGKGAHSTRPLLAPLEMGGGS